MRRCWKATVGRAFAVLFFSSTFMSFAAVRLVRLQRCCSFPCSVPSVHASCVPALMDSCLSLLLLQLRCLEFVTVFAMFHCNLSLLSLLRLLAWMHTCTKRSDEIDTRENSPRLLDFAHHLPCPNPASCFASLHRQHQHISRLHSWTLSMGRLRIY